MLDLEAIELIKQLKARYFRFLDTRNLEGCKRYLPAMRQRRLSAVIRFSADWLGQLEAFYKNRSRVKTSVCTTGITLKSASMAIRQQASGICRTYSYRSSTT